jgi:hypothetical protein
MHTHTAMNTLNLGFRFLLELAALFTVGYWGWHRDIGAFRFVLGIVGPCLFAAVWYTFNTKDDPSRSGKAPVPVPGIVRLVLEIVLFVMATIGAYSSISKLTGIIFGSAVLIHYIASYKRISWMLRN